MHRPGRRRMPGLPCQDAFVFCVLYYDLVEEAFGHFFPVRSCYSEPIVAEPGKCNLLPPDVRWHDDKQGWYMRTGSGYVRLRGN